ncbi:unnamed protein product [Closterium sp. NIES-54]
MYAIADSADGDCYLRVPPDPGIAVAALGASAAAALGASGSAAPGAGASPLSGIAPTETLHTFTLDSGASRSFFRDSTTLKQLSRPVAVSLADPSGGPVLAHSSTVLPYPAAPSGLLSGLHLPSFSTNLVSGADLQDAWVDQFTPGDQRVTHSTFSWTGRHQATFTRRPGSSLYTLTTAPPPFSASGQVAASSQMFADASRSSPASAHCSCRPLAHKTLLWHHCLGHPSLPRLRGMASRALVSGLSRSLTSLPPGPAPTCVPCFEGRQPAAPHSSLFPPTEAPLQTLYMDVWGPARVRGQGHERYFLLVIDDYSRYTTVFPLRSKGEVPEGIRHTFMLPASPQQNGIAERRIGMVMDVARTSMIHAAAPHFVWPIAAQYAAHQINLQPRVSLPDTTPTLRWTGKVGDASAFRVLGSRAFVRDTTADKLSSHAVPFVFLGFPPDAPGWQFYHPTLRHVLSSQDVTFDESVSYYRLFPYRIAPPPPPPPPLFLPVEVAVDSGAESGGAEPTGAGTGGAESGSAGSGRVEPEGTVSGGAEPARAASGGALGIPPQWEPLSPQQLREWYSRRCQGTAGATGGGAGAGAAGEAAGAAGAGAAGAAAGAGAAGGAGGAAGAGATGGTAGASGAAAGAGSAGGAAWTSGGAAGDGSASAGAAGGAACAGAAGGAGGAAGGASRTGDPGAGGNGSVSTVSGGPVRPRPYYVPLLQQVLGSPPSPGPPPPFLSPPPVQSHSRFQPASPVPGTYVDEVPPPGANIVSGMWIFRVKRPPGSPPVFKARYVARGFSQRQGVDFFQTFSPTPKKTTLRILRHVAAQRDYELHSLDFSTAFLQGSLHEEIWQRRPPGFTESFPAGTQWSLRRPVYGLRQAPREWHDTLRTTLASLGFAPSTVDPSLFLRTNTTLAPFYVLVYVDDLVFATADTEALAHVLQRFGFTYSSPQSTPLPTGHSLSTPPSDKSVEPSGPYPELVGCLITSGMGLVLGGRARVVLTGHADAFWVDDLATQRSSQGYTFSLGSGSVSWRSTRSSSVLSSSCEAEIYAGAMAAQELHWLTYLLTDLGEAPRSPPVLYVDNKAMLALCQEHRLEHRTKHIALR